MIGKAEKHGKSPVKSRKYAFKVEITDGPNYNKAQRNYLLRIVTIILHLG